MIQRTKISEWLVQNFSDSKEKNTATSLRNARGLGFVNRFFFLTGWGREEKFWEGVYRHLMEYKSTGG